MKLIICLLLLSISAHGSITLNKLDFTKTKSEGRITVEFSGQMNGIPELRVIGEAIQVEIPDSKVKANMEKSVSFSSKVRDTQIRAYQTTASKTKIKAMFPFNMSKRQNAVSLKLDDNKIELVFPRVRKTITKQPKQASILPKKKAAVEKKHLDESYLNNLLKIEDKDTTKIIKPIALKKTEEETTDKVGTLQSAPAGTLGAQDISLIKYGGKFAAFLGVVLLLFYGVMTLMKKGFIKKGKLGFLGSTEKIMVLNQHYIAPKKSLMLIKAHNQVFLVSNTDNGIHPISEIRDVAGLIKDEERTLAGHNFDTNLDLAEVSPENDVKIKIKEDISQSNKESSLSSYKEVKDRIKFSDQIKEKVKGLKSLQ